MDKQTQQKLLNLVKCNYEEIAEDFNETRKKYLWPEIIKLTKDVKDGNKVLDIGCGNGRLLEAFKDKKINYVGVDSSEKLINIAKARYKIQDTRYKFIKGDILELDKLNEASFDYVFCVAVLHHLPGQDLQIRALEQMKNKVSKDGKIVIMVWNLWSQEKFRKLILKYALQKLIGRSKMDFKDILFKGFNKKSERYYHAFTNCELMKIAKLAGLKIDKLYKDRYNYYAILKK